MSYTYNEGPKVKNQIEIDHKIIKRVYPRTNNNTSLKFIAEKDPNLNLRLHSAKLIFATEFPKTYTPDMGFPLKLFNDLKIDFNSQILQQTGKYFY